MKTKIITLALALIMVLTFSACGDANSPNGGNTTTPSEDNMVAPSQSQTPINSSSADDDSATTPVSTTGPTDGNFLYWNLVANSKADGGIWGIALCFQGDTTQAQPTLESLKIYFEDTQQQTPTYDTDVTYYAELNRTDYAFLFTKDFTLSNNLDIPGNYYFEVTCNGIVLRHPTIRWNEDGSTSTVEEALLPTINILASTPPTQSSSDGTQNPSTPAHGAEVLDIPDNGTPPTVSAAMESHAGDKAYFYTTTDDYIVYVTDGSDNPIITSSGIETKVYVVESFDSVGKWDSNFSKYVFKSQDDATAFNAQAGSTAVVQIDNVIYFDYTNLPSAPPSENMQQKDKAISIITSGGYDYYISKP